MKWTKVVDRLPPFDHGKVLVFTDGVDFGGEQFFTVEAETLYLTGDGEMVDEVAVAATHWAELPYPAKFGRQDPINQALNEGDGVYRP